MSEDNTTAAPPPPPAMSDSDRRAIEAAKAADAAKKEMPPAPPVKRASKKQAKKSTLGKYKSKVIPMYHPYQKVTIPVSHDVPLEVDNWLQVQVDAGVIIRCD